MTDIEFTPAKFRAFKGAYEVAKAAGAESFIFEGAEVLTAYARYMVEYLGTIFPDVDPNFDERAQ